MLVLALDTALDACACAVLDHGAAPTRVTAQTDVIGRGHAERLMDLIAATLDHAGVALTDVDRFAVSVGPGSFTGIRVGVAVARGFAVATGKPCVGISSLEALGADGRASLPGRAILAAIDARRGEVYAQAFAADGTPVSEAAAMAIPAAAALAAVHGAALIGSGTALLRAENPALDVAAERAFPAIETIAHLAAERPDLHRAPKPFYLRAADAKPQEGFRIARAAVTASPGTATPDAAATAGSGGPERDGGAA